MRRSIQTLATASMLIFLLTACGGGQTVNDEAVRGQGDVGNDGRVDDSRFVEVLESAMNGAEDGGYCPTAPRDAGLPDGFDIPSDEKPKLTAENLSIESGTDRWTVDFDKMQQGVTTQDVDGTTSFDPERVIEQRSRADMTVLEDGNLCVLNIRKLADEDFSEQKEKEREADEASSLDSMAGKEEGFLGRPLDIADPIQTDARLDEGLPTLVSIEEFASSGPGTTERGLDEERYQCNSEDRVIWGHSSRGFDVRSYGVICANDNNGNYYFKGAFDRDTYVSGKVVEGTLSSAEFEIETDDDANLSISKGKWQYTDPSGVTRTTPQLSAGYVIRNN